MQPQQCGAKQGSLCAPLRNLQRIRGILERTLQASGSGFPFGAAPPRTDGVQCGMDGGPIEPSPRAATSAPRARKAHENILRHILSLARIARNAERDADQAVIFLGKEALESRIGRIEERRSRHHAVIAPPGDDL